MKGKGEYIKGKRNIKGKGGGVKTFNQTFIKDVML
jgi:hypothetical protein